MSIEGVEGGDDLRTSRLKPLSGKRIALIAVAVFAVASTVGLALWIWVGTTGLERRERSTAQLQVLQFALGIGVAAGGSFALFLAFRRQSHAEITAAVLEHDATERRVTELYTKAVDQLGSDNAAVRMGGLYALERLAQDNAPQRQMIVNVLCSYLRMPIDSEVDDPSGSKQEVESRRSLEERQVRLTAQRMIQDHLTWTAEGEPPPTPDTYWVVDLDLSSAHLERVDFSSCRLLRARFDDANFIGRCSFDGTDFASVASFDGATFDSHASFNHAKFRDSASFRRAVFKSDVEFDKVPFSGAVNFRSVKFEAGAWLEGARFGGPCVFDFSSVADSLVLKNTHAEHEISIVRARLDSVSLEGAAVHGPLNLNFSTVSTALNLNAASFSKDVRLRNTKLAFDGAVPKYKGQDVGLLMVGTKFAEGVPSMLGSIDRPPTA